MTTQTSLPRAADEQPAQIAPVAPPHIVIVRVAVWAGVVLASLAVWASVLFGVAIFVNAV
jgi:hypothetical protein